MSTRIDINVASELLRRLAKAQADANRQGLQEREKRGKLTDKATAEAKKEADRRAQQGAGQDGRPPQRYRFREEPAATPRVSSSDGIGFAWVYQAPGALNGLETSLFAVESSSRNTSATFELNVGNGDVFGTGYSLVALPCGGDNMIIVVTSDVRLYPGDTRQFTPDYKAVVVGRNAVRMISVPTAFRNLWTSSDVPRIWPPTAEYFFPVAFQYNYFMESVRRYGFSYNVVHGVPDGVLSTSYDLNTPGWYLLLNGTLESVSTFQNMSSTIAYKESLLAAAPRPTYELAFVSSPAGRFDLDRYPAQPDTTETYDPLLWRASGIKPISFDANAAPPSGFDAEDCVYTASWDWGNPSYCRQQLLALGFTAADLTP